MMLFSRTAVRRIYALCYLNQANNGNPLSSPAVASTLGIPRDQAAKVMQSLNNAGLVQPTRGRRGGYLLMKNLDEISVADVLDALNPPDDDEHLRPKSCRRVPTHMCGVRRGLRELNDRVRKALVGETLRGLAGSVCSDLDTSSGERRAELVCVTQGENCP